MEFDFFTGVDWALLSSVSLIRIPVFVSSSTLSVIPFSVPSVDMLNDEVLGVSGLVLFDVILRRSRSFADKGSSFFSSCTLDCSLILDTSLLEIFRVIFSILFLNDVGRRRGDAATLEDLTGVEAGEFSTLIGVSFETETSVTTVAGTVLTSGRGTTGAGKEIGSIAVSTGMGTSMVSSGFLTFSWILLLGDSNDSTTLLSD